ncbi:F-actin-capping protein, partial [Dissophora globulifera]
LSGAIKEFGGGVVIISHNREFTDTVTVEKWSVNAGVLVVSGNNYTQKNLEKIVMKEEETKIDAFGNVEKVKSTRKLSRKEIKEKQKRRAAAKKRGEEVLVSKHGQIDSDHFLHPKTNKVFKLDHFRQIASDPEDHTVDEEMEELRKVVEKDVEDYVGDRYAEGVLAVYGAQGVITIAIVHNKYSPSNFWNGRWRSVWTLDTATGEVKGSLKCKVHYYEDGNVQLETSKEVEDKLSKSSSEPHKVISKALVDLVSAAEHKYQEALNESYHDLAETTFNGLRRALPYTRTKLDWNKILTYRIGAELAAK